MSQEAPKVDLKVGDYVYAVYDRGDCAWRKGPRLTMQRAQVKSIGKKIHLTRSGLAFHCRCQFDLDAMGRSFAATPAQALAAFHATKKREEEQHLEAAAEARKLQELREYDNDWEKRPGW